MSVDEKQLSHVDVLCTDKTGTLTANALAVEVLHPYGMEEAELRRVLGSYIATLHPIVLTGAKGPDTRDGVGRTRFLHTATACRNTGYTARKNLPSVGYLTRSITGGLVTQSSGLDGSIGKSLKKKIAVFAAARIGRIAWVKTWTRLGIP